MELPTKKVYFLHIDQHDPWLVTTTWSREWDWCNILWLWKGIWLSTSPASNVKTHWPRSGPTWLKCCREWYNIQKLTCNFRSLSGLNFGSSLISYFSSTLMMWSTVHSLLALVSFCIQMIFFCTAPFPPARTILTSLAIRLQDQVNCNHVSQPFQMQVYTDLSPTEQEKQPAY